MTKKLLAMLLALVMVISLVACGNANAPAETEAPKADAPAKETEAPAAEETEAPEVNPADVEFSVMLKATIEDASEMPIAQLFQELTGYEPDYIEVSPAAAEEQMQLMWMEENLPDVLVMSLSNADVTRAAAEGQIIDLAPYIKNPELMPNLHKCMQDYEWEMVADSEGHIYSFPRILENRLQTGLGINVEWLDKLGLEKPETPEELLEVWRAFKTQDPNGNGQADEIPFMCELVWENAVDTMDPMFGMFGVVGGWQVDENGKVFFGQTKEEYKEGLKFFRQAFSEGLLDAEIFTQDMTGFSAKSQTNPTTAGTVLAYTWGNTVRIFTDDTVGQYDHLLPMKAEDGVRYWEDSGAYPTSHTQGTAVITSSCENIEDVCRWIDCMYDPVVGLQIDSAPFEYGLALNTEGELAGLYSTGASACPDADYGEYADYGTWRSAMHSNAFPRILSEYAKAQFGVQTTTAITNVASRIWFNQNDLYRAECTLNNYLLMDGANEEEAEVEATYLTEFTNYWRNQCANWIAGNGDIDAEWDEFQQGLIDMGLEELAASYQSRYDRIH